MKGYELGHAACDPQSRRKKAAMIAAVLERVVDLPNANVLDIGTGTGVISRELAQRAASVTSIDVIDSRSEVTGYAFQIVQDEHLPFPAQSFDAVISNHVIEHVKDQRLHLAEAARVLRGTGVIYLATPNRWWPIEPHYHLPLLSLLPQWAADAYLRSTLRRRWDVKLLSPRRLEAIAGDAGLAVDDESIGILQAPQEYGLTFPRPVRIAVARTPRPLMRHIIPFLPTQVRTLRPIGRTH